MALFLLVIELAMVAAVAILLIVSVVLQVVEDARADRARRREPGPTATLHVARRRRAYDWDRERDGAA